MSSDYVEGWFYNKDSRSELSVQLQDGLIFLTEFLGDETIKKHVYSISRTSEEVIKEILAHYESFGRLTES